MSVTYDFFMDSQYLIFFSKKVSEKKREKKMNLRNTQRGVFFVKFKRRFRERERLVQCRGKEERERESHSQVFVHGEIGFSEI